jgi:Ca2+-binding RTX toxin-like protein
VTLGLGSLLVRTGTGTDAIHIEGFNPDAPFDNPVIENFRFADGSELSLEELLARGFDISGDGALRGTALTDRITGGAGDDVLTGAAGNDTLAGAEGNDTYVLRLGDGNDTVIDVVTDAAGNLIVFGEGVTRASLVFEYEDAGLRIRYGETDSVLLAGYGVDGNRVVAEVAFADGSIVSMYELTNRAPVLLEAPSDQAATGGQAFRYALPAGSFADVDFGDALTYSATLADGTPLPVWLKLDAASGVFSGTPGNADAGSLALAVTATDRGGLSAAAGFTLTIGRTITGTGYNDTLTGTGWNDFISGGAGDDAITGSGGADTIVGGTGSDNLKGGAGDDTFAIAGTDTGYDRFEGDEGFDTILGSTGDDTIRINYYTGVSMVERIDGGLGSNAIAGTGYNDTLDFSGTEIINIAKIDGGAGDDAITGSAGNDYLMGGLGNDRLVGAGSLDLLQGGDGNDVIGDLAGNNLFDGGNGNDTLTDDGGNSLLVGGKGNDTINAGDGYDVIAFNKGDGYDTVSFGANAQDSVSLGGGISYTDLKLKKSGNDLVLDTGSGEGMVFKNWYAATPVRNVVNLQVMADAMAGFDQASNDPLLNQMVQDFDFKGMVGAFDTARAATPTLTSWALANALTQFHLSGSDTAALGGDLAYQYGKNVTLAGIGIASAQQVLGDANFGSQTQALKPLSGLQEGMVCLS